MQTGERGNARTALEEVVYTVPLLLMSKEVKPKEEGMLMEERERYLPAPLGIRVPTVNEPDKIALEDGRLGVIVRIALVERKWGG